MQAGRAGKVRRRAAAGHTVILRQADRRMKADSKGCRKVRRRAAAGHTVILRQADRRMKADSKECGQVRRRAAQPDIQ